MSVLLAYAMFILLAALPFIAAALVISGFAYGVMLAITGLWTGRPLSIALGLMLVAVNGAVMVTVAHWATTRPTATSHRAHEAVYKGFQGLRAWGQAMRWLSDGTLQRLSDEQRAREARKDPKPRDER